MKTQERKHLSLQKSLHRRKTVRRKRTEAEWRKESRKRKKVTKMLMQLASIFSWCSSRRSLLFWILWFSYIFSLTHFPSFFTVWETKLEFKKWMRWSEKNKKRKTKKQNKKVPSEYERLHESGRYMKEIYTEKLPHISQETAWEYNQAWISALPRHSYSKYPWHFS